MIVGRATASCLTLFAPLLLGGCVAPLGCTSTAVVERLSVKLDREMREDFRFLAPHDPDRSSFGISGVRQDGVEDGALACSASFVAVLDAGRAYAAAHGFEAPPKPSILERLVHFTAHRSRWDTYVEVVSLDAAPPASQLPTSKVSAP